MSNVSEQRRRIDDRIHYGQGSRCSASKERSDDPAMVELEDGRGRENAERNDASEAIVRRKHPQTTDLAPMPTTRSRSWDELWRRLLAEPAV